MGGTFLQKTWKNTSCTPTSRRNDMPCMWTFFHDGSTFGETFQKFFQLRCMLAAQQYWVAEAPHFGSRQVRKLEEEVALQCWDRSDERLLPPRQGWMMTTQTRTLLEQVCKCTWLDPDRDRQTILQILQQYPISGDEIREIQMAMIQYHDDPDITENITLCFGPILQQARPTMTDYLCSSNGYQREDCWTCKRPTTTGATCSQMSDKIQIRGPLILWR